MKRLIIFMLFTMLTMSMQAQTFFSDTPISSLENSGVKHMISQDSSNYNWVRIPVSDFFPTVGDVTNGFFNIGDSTYYKTKDGDLFHLGVKSSSWQISEDYMIVNATGAEIFGKVIAREAGEFGWGGVNNNGYTITPFHDQAGFTKIQHLSRNTSNSIDTNNPAFDFEYNLPNITNWDDGNGIPLVYSAFPWQGSAIGENQKLWGVGRANNEELLTVSFSETKVNNTLNIQEAIVMQPHQTAPNSPAINEIRLAESGGETTLVIYHDPVGANPLGWYDFAGNSYAW